MKTGETVTACGKAYRLIRLLGHGKGGYSWLAEADGREVVLKQIHHEPCDYYTFGNKIEAECRDYERLKNAGIRIPEMITADRESERIVKEYIAGETVFDYECNEYMDQWSFENWGIRYWSRTQEFEAYLKEQKQRFQEPIS